MKAPKMKGHTVKRTDFPSSVSLFLSVDNIATELGQLEKRYVI